MEIDSSTERGKKEGMGMPGLKVGSGDGSGFRNEDSVSSRCSNLLAVSFDAMKMVWAGIPGIIWNSEKKAKMPTEKLVLRR